MRNILSLLTEYALYLQTDNAQFKKYYEENVIAKKRESFDEMKKLLSAKDQIHKLAEENVVMKEEELNKIVEEERKKNLGKDEN